MIRSLLIFACLLVAVLPVRGQSAGFKPANGDLLEELLENGRRGQVRIYVDSLLVVNYYKLMAQNSEINGVPGYRIRIFSESGVGAKEEQQRVRAKFLSLYPGIDVYNRYDEPFFKLYVGDCRTMSEALKLYDLVEKNFPNPILVEDYIQIGGND